MLRYLADLWEPWEDPRVEVEHLLDRVEAAEVDVPLDRRAVE
jgi:hypothetical protein